jgi:hypothetical protein
MPTFIGGIRFAILPKFGGLAHDFPRAKIGQITYDSLHRAARIWVAIPQSLQFDAEP